MEDADLAQSEEEKSEREGEGGGKKGGLEDINLSTPLLFGREGEGGEEQGVGTDDGRQPRLEFFDEKAEDGGAALEPLLSPSGREEMEASDSTSQGFVTLSPPREEGLPTQDLAEGMAYAYRP